MIKIVLLAIAVTTFDGDLQVYRFRMPDMETCKASAIEVQKLNPSLRVGCVHDIGLP